VREKERRKKAEGGIRRVNKRCYRCKSNFLCVHQQRKVEKKLYTVHVVRTHLLKQFFIK
jgi:hypothetical protein